MNHVANHYNNQKNRSIKERNNTANKGVRSFNGMLKYVLIRENLPSNAEVLEIAVGKGGDLKKYQGRGVKYLVGLDISNISLLDVLRRYNEDYFDYRFRLKCLDCFNMPFDLKKQFDFVSIQYSFHYAFTSKETLSQATENISRHMRIGAKLVMTVPNKKEITKRIRMKIAYNNLYKITPSEKLLGTLSNNEENQPDKLYKQPYLFYLKDSIDNCEEYLVDDKELLTVFKEYGLMPLENYTVPNYARNHRGTRDRNSKDLHMEREQLREEEREVVDLYQVYVFHKIRKVAPPKSD